MVPVVLGVTYFGGLPFVALWMIAAAAVLHEWAHVAKLAPASAFLVIGLLGIGGGAADIYLASGSYAPLAVLAAAFACALVTRSLRSGASGVVIAALACLPLMVLRGDDRIGLSAVLFVYAIVWCTDIGAYFVGRAVGGPKLWPRLSPNKTWSGAIGGALIGTAAGCGLLVATGLRLVPEMAAIGLVLSIAAQCGDLAESAFKRAYGVKDAGSLIPGHGGVLDRLDGFTAAAVAALVIGLVRNIDAPAIGLLLW
ncbi:phosphatidate cytidylyltransferase [Aquabacter spiritensis]|uniref:Phosphatidate cytidylyltransferase n=2 Tax=Aquabacter spiritensis TaxID=933073 RepID=A0A4R3LW73_9HYPH|nr:phosphatidate cytidylyltransferase [Aquabacter spiritensis]